MNVQPETRGSFIRGLRPRGWAVGAGWELPDELLAVLRSLGSVIDLSSEVELRPNHYALLVLHEPNHRAGTFLRLVAALRAQDTAVPILALGEDWPRQTVAEMLDAGADDALSGPFQPFEVRARVCALVRRSTGLWPVPESPKVRINRPSRLVEVDGTLAELSATELRIFEYLARHEGQWCRGSDIVREVFHTHHARNTSLVRVHLCRIRKALGRAGRFLRGDSRKGFVFELES